VRIGGDRASTRAAGTYSGTVTLKPFQFAAVLDMVIGENGVCVLTVDNQIYCSGELASPWTGPLNFNPIQDPRSMP